jgi:hypothetical protein
MGRSWTSTIFGQVRNKASKENDLSTRTESQMAFSGELLIREPFGPVDYTLRVARNDGRATVRLFDGSPEDVKHYESSDDEIEYTHIASSVMLDGDDEADGEKIAAMVVGYIQAQLG